MAAPGPSCRQRSVSRRASAERWCLRYLSNQARVYQAAMSMPRGSRGQVGMPARGEQEGQRVLGLLVGVLVGGLVLAVAGRLLLNVDVAVVVGAGPVGVRLPVALGVEAHHQVAVPGQLLRVP